MINKIDKNVIMKSLNWAYSATINENNVIKSPEKIAEEYLKNNKGDKIKAANEIIKWNTVKCGVSGFVTGFGGILAMPLTIPANLGSVFFFQIRMIATIAAIGGYNIHSDKIKSFVFVCLAGKSALDILKEVGIKLGRIITKKIIEQISGQVLIQINKAVGFRLLTKFGQKGLINLEKSIPIVGGMVGGLLDATTTKTIGKIANKIFLSQ